MDAWLYNTIFFYRWEPREEEMLIRRAEKTVRNTRNLDFLHKINIEQRFHGNVAVSLLPKSIEFFFSFLVSISGYETQFYYGTTRLLYFSSSAKRKLNSINHYCN